MTETPGEKIAKLEERVADLRADYAELRMDVRKNSEDIGALRRFQAWLLGGAAVVGAVLSHFASALVERLK